MAIPHHRNTPDLTDPLASSQELHEAFRGAQEPRAPPRIDPSPNAAATRRRSSSPTALHRPTARIRALVSIYRQPHTFCASFRGRSSHQNPSSTALRRGTPPAPSRTPPRPLSSLTECPSGLRVPRACSRAKPRPESATGTPIWLSSAQRRRRTRRRRRPATAFARVNPEPPDLESTC